MQYQPYIDISLEIWERIYILSYKTQPRSGIWRELQMNCVEAADMHFAHILLPSLSRAVATQFPLSSTSLSLLNISGLQHLPFQCTQGESEALENGYPVSSLHSVTS